MVISLSGMPGCYAEQALNQAYTEPITIHYCNSFQEAVQALGYYADQVILPVSTSHQGEVTEVQQLLRYQRLTMIEQWSLATHHCLLALKGETLDSIHTVYSHPKALEECREFLSTLSVKQVPYFNTAASASLIQKQRWPRTAAIASKAAADIYDLTVLCHHIEDNDDQTIFGLFEK